MVRSFVSGRNTALVTEGVFFVGSVSVSVVQAVHSREAGFFFFFWRSVAARGVQAVHCRRFCFLCGALFLGGMQAVH